MSATRSNDRQQRLAAKLRENLHRRKAQARARSQSGADTDNDKGKEANIAQTGKAGPSNTDQ